MLYSFSFALVFSHRVFHCKGFNEVTINKDRISEYITKHSSTQRSLNLNESTSRGPHKAYLSKVLLHTRAPKEWWSWRSTDSFKWQSCRPVHQSTTDIYFQEISSRDWNASTKRYSVVDIRGSSCTLFPSSSFFPIGFFWQGFNEATNCLFFLIF